jgi:hypothetical protein
MPFGRLEISDINRIFFLVKNAVGGSVQLTGHHPDAQLRLRVTHN